MSLITLDTIKSFKIKVNNNLMNSIGLSATVAQGYREIEFEIDLIDGIPEDLFNGRREIEKIETPMGILIGCFITGFETDGDNTSLNGIARNIDPYIEIIFKNETKPKRIKASLYNEVIKQLRKDITFEEYQRQAFVEEI